MMMMMITSRYPGNTDDFTAELESTQWSA